MPDNLKTYLPVGLLAVVLFACLQLISSSIQSSWQLWAEGAAIDAQQTSEQSLDQRILALKVANRRQAKELDSLSSGLIKIDAQSDLLKFLGQCAADNDVDIRQLEPGAVVQNDNINILPVTLQLSGDFAAITRMLYRLEYQTASYRSREVTLINNPARPGLLEAQISLEAIAR